MLRDVGWMASRTDFTSARENRVGKGGLGTVSWASFAQPSVRGEKHLRVLDQQEDEDRELMSQCSVEDL